jgi:hypothetical protein
MRLPNLILKVLQTLAILLCSELLFLPLLSSIGLGLLVLASVLFFYSREHPQQILRIQLARPRS